MKKLEALIRQLECKILAQTATNTSVSAASVGWHIEHSLLVVNSIMNTLQKSDPAQYKWKFNLNKLLVMSVLNKMPRGRGKAPEVVKPKGDFTSESLKNHVESTIKRLPALNSLDSNSHFKHPYFGQLNLKSAIHFIEIHTKHHLEIVDDILK
jgi:hypothetical protein